MKPVLHLMVNNTCTNDCPLCCNKQYDVDDIPVVTVEDLRNVDTICLTGGAPMLSIEKLADFTSSLEKMYKNIENVFIYMNGAELYSIYNLNIMMSLRRIEFFPYNTVVNYGLTISPKCEKDWESVWDMSKFIYAWKSKRIYCFTDDDVVRAKELLPICDFEIVRREWQKKFVPAPNTFFRRLPVWIS